MLDKQAIRSIIVDRFGITDLSSYQIWQKDKFPLLSAEDKLLLHPDNVYTRDFWEVVGELFLFDPVTNCEFNPELNNAIDSTCRNMYFAVYHKIFSFIHPRIKFVLEIGAGYGWMKDYLYVFNPTISYTGVDVLPRKEFILPATREGLLDLSSLGNHYDIAISSNTFQHLSTNQKLAYFKDISRIANEFVFTIGSEKTVIHYGQIIDQLSLEELDQALKHYWSKVKFYQITNILYTVHCIA